MADVYVRNNGRQSIKIVAQALTAKSRGFCVDECAQSLSPPNYRPPDVLSGGSTECNQICPARSQFINHINHTWDLLPGSLPTEMNGGEGPSVPIVGFAFRVAADASVGTNIVEVTFANAENPAETWTSAVEVEVE